METKRINWDVEGMSCVNCAQTIVQYLTSSHLENVHVDFATGKVSFELTDEAPPSEELKKGLKKIGYTVVTDKHKPPFWTPERKLLVSAIFTVPLVAGHFLMLAGVMPAFLSNMWVQAIVAVPPIAIGLWHFGKSALGSLRGGIPNMDVLVFTGGLAATVYSVIGLALGEPDYIFFETAASIFTLVLLGNYLEHRSVEQTTTALKSLQRLRPATARKVMASGTIVEVETDDIHTGDIVQVNEGDALPADGKVLEGFGSVDESMFTGESLPVDKSAGDKVFGGTLVVKGNLRVEVTAAAGHSLLDKIIELVERAQNDKPPIQRLADRISAIFVPAVISIAILTFLVSWLGFHIPVTQALIRAIAVLVISCPCAMGLATPTAVMVGVGRMAKEGIVIKGGTTVELLREIRRVVFDKTGTLTSGQFKVAGIHYQEVDPVEVQGAIKGLESRSSHPLAVSLMAEMERLAPDVEPLELDVREHKGHGIYGTDKDGNSYKLGSARILTHPPKEAHDLYLLKNDRLIAAIDLDDELKEGAHQVVDYFKRQGIEVVLLSGDREEKVRRVAETLGIDAYYAAQLPDQKLAKIETWSREEPTAMVGDGINDAPALSKATLGISMGSASAVAAESARVVILNDKLPSLEKAFRVSRATVKTIRENLFWAFAYNVVAIPIAAMGYLNPMWGALFMAFSDIVVIGNSLRLKRRKT